MSILSSGTMREVAKFCLDLSKLTVAAAFITPCFTTVDIEPYVTSRMAFVALLTFVLGILLHRITDHQEGKD